MIWLVPERISATSLVAATVCDNDAMRCDTDKRDDMMLLLPDIRACCLPWPYQTNATFSDFKLQSEAKEYIYLNTSNNVIGCVGSWIPPLLVPRENRMLKLSTNQMASRSCYNFQIPMYSILQYKGHNGDRRIKWVAKIARPYTFIHHHVSASSSSSSESDKEEDVLSRVNDVCQ